MPDEIPKSETRIRGFAIRGLLKYVKESGHSGGTSIVGRLPAEVRPRFAKPIDKDEWYPYAAYAELLRLVDRELGKGDLSLCQELGRYAAEGDVNAAFKIVAFFSSVETLLKRSVVFWRRYCDTGTFLTTEVGKGWGRGELRDFPHVAEEHCHLLTGWVEGMALAAGADGVSVEKTKCVHRGDEVCRYEGTWR